MKKLFLLLAMFSIIIGTAQSQTVFVNQFTDTTTCMPFELGPNNDCIFTFDTAEDHLMCTGGGGMGEFILYDTDIYDSVKIEMFGHAIKSESWEYIILYNELGEQITYSSDSIFNISIITTGHKIYVDIILAHPEIAIYYIDSVVCTGYNLNTSTNIILSNKAPNLTGIYNISGQKINTPKYNSNKPEVYIYKYSDGSYEKKLIY